MILNTLSYQELIKRSQIPEAIVALMQDLLVLNIHEIDLSELVVRLVQNGYQLEPGESLGEIVKGMPDNWDTYQSVINIINHANDATKIGLIMEQFEDNSLHFTLNKEYSDQVWADINFKI